MILNYFYVNLMERKGIGKARTPELLKSPRLTTKSSTLSLKRLPNHRLIRSKPPTPGSFPKTKKTTPQFTKTTPKVSSAQRSKSPQPTPVSRYGASKTTPKKPPRSLTTATKDAPLPRLSGRARTPEMQAADKLQVAIRIRPYNQREKRGKNDPVTINEKTVSVNQEDKSQTFTFDECFWSEDSKHPQWASQRIVYEKLGKPLLSQALEGYNVSLMAYGQTGSGKSYSMMGLPVTQDDGVTLSPTAGIIPRFAKDLFDRIEDETIMPPDYKYFIEISFCEIYNEKIQDLLSDENAALRVREHPVDGPFIENLRVVSVTSFEALMRLINTGNRRRATASTNLNDTSSRSHSIFTVHLKQSWNDHDDVTGETRFSKMHFVDLAGSEKLGNTEQCDRWKEGVSINKSLLTLSKVITALAEGTHAPYRDSVITFILRESLGGNAKTALLATVSPSHQHVEETLATLRYARGASGIVNKPIINEEASSKQIKHLKEEIARLTTTMQHTPHLRVDSAEAVEEIEYLKRELQKKEELVREINRIWIARLQEEKAKNDHQDMEDCVEFPRLVKLHEDPQLNGKVAYPLPADGEVMKISRRQRGVMVSAQEHGSTIYLPGVQIGTPHCSIACNGDKLIIQPMDAWKIHVNGEEVQERRMLREGDCVILGLQHFLWIQERESPYPDFHDVRQILWKRQEEKLTKDLRQQYSEKCDELKEKATCLAEQLKETEKQLQQEQDLNGFMKRLNDMETPFLDDSPSEEIEEMRNLRRKFQEDTNGIRTPDRDRSPIRQIRGKMIKETHKVFKDLEAEGKRIEERMQITGSDGSDIKPAQLFAMVDEANQLVNGLLPRLCFSLEYSPESKLTVKVTQIDHGTATFWCATNFHENLMKLRLQKTPNIGFMLQDPSSWVISSKSSVGEAVYKTMNRVHRRLTDSWNMKRQPASTSCLPSGFQKVAVNKAQIASFCQSSINLVSSHRYTHFVDHLFETILALAEGLESLYNSILLDKESLIGWDSQLMRCCLLSRDLRTQGNMIRCNAPEAGDVEQISELISTIQHLLGFVCQNKKLMMPKYNVHEYVEECSEALKKLVYHMGALCIDIRVVPEAVVNCKLSTNIKDRLKDGVKASLKKACEKALQTSKYSEVTVTSVIDNVQVTGRTRNQVLLDVFGMVHELTVAITMFFTNSIRCQGRLENEENIEISIALGHNVISIEQDVEKLAKLTHSIYEGKSLLEGKVVDLCDEIELKVCQMFPDYMECNASFSSLSFLEVVSAKGSSLQYLVKDILFACRRLRKAATKFYGLESDENRSFWNKTITP